jgi:outer membrane immunogenic protein
MHLGDSHGQVARLCWETFFGLKGIPMKKLLTSALFVVLGSAAGLAADLPMKAMPYAAPPVFSWTGCYVGVHAGAGVMHDTWTDENGTGGLAGGQLGCNYQDGNWVFGAEGEGYWSGIKATDARSGSLSNLTQQFAIGGLTTDTLTAKNKYDFSIAARAGIAFDRTLVYGKAGWVWGQFDFLDTHTAPCCSLTFGPLLSTNAASGTLDGLLLGVGIEHALTNNWTVKLEYNFLRYGSKEISFVDCNNRSTPACGLPFTNTQHADKQIFKIGVNYLFNMAPAAVVAKY